MLFKNNYDLFKSQICPSVMIVNETVMIVITVYYDSR